jgi:hypothetical protein
MGACCWDGVCIGTMTYFECSSFGGDWYEGENCGEFICP